MNQIKRKLNKRIYSYVAVFVLITVISFNQISLHNAFALSENLEQESINDFSYENVLYAPNRVLLKYRKGTTKTEKNNFLKRNNLKEKQKINNSDIVIVGLPEKASPVAVVKRLEKLEKKYIEFVEVDALNAPSFIPDDPQYLNQWHLPAINSVLAWDTSTGEDMIIAIADTGVDPDHPDLQGHLVPGWNYYNENSDTSDIHGHGTAVAGTVAAIGNNANQISGVAFNASIMPLRIAKPDAWAYTSDMAQAIMHAADNGVRVVNMSYSGWWYSTVQSAAQYLKDRNGYLVVSAGNEGTNLGYAPVDNIIIVAATAKNNTRASFSSYGDYIDIAAPGYYILTTNNGGGTGYWNGTSFASPCVAGVLAMIWSVNPSLSPDEAEDLLKSTALDLGEFGPDQYFGWGQVDAGAAMERAKNYVPYIDIIDPAISISNPLDNSALSGLVTIQAEASDNQAVVRVEYFIDNVFYFQDSSVPFAVEWDTKKYTNGAYQLTARAYDAAGNNKTSEIVNVIVNNIVVVDTLAPSILITSLSDGETISGVVKMEANAYDESGIVEMNCYLDGKLLKTVAEDFIGCLLKANKLDSGSHNILVNARDAYNNINESSINVFVAETVDNPGVLKKAKK